MCGHIEILPTTFSALLLYTALFGYAVIHTQLVTQHKGTTLAKLLTIVFNLFLMMNTFACTHAHICLQQVVDLFPCKMTSCFLTHTNQI